ncbi:hypothetical protein IAU59_007575 [Kwoniella sp. CBS 9459]
MNDRQQRRPVVLSSGIVTPYAPESQALPYTQPLGTHSPVSERAPLAAEHRHPTLQVQDERARRYRKTGRPPKRVRPTDDDIKNWVELGPGHGCGRCGKQGVPCWVPRFSRLPPSVEQQEGIATAQSTTGTCYKCYMGNKKCELPYGVLGGGHMEVCLDKLKEEVVKLNEDHHGEGVNTVASDLSKSVDILRRYLHEHPTTV